VEHEVQRDVVRREQALGTLGVVGGQVGERQHLEAERLVARLAALCDQELDEVTGAAHHLIAEAEDAGGPLAHGQRTPGDLRGAGARRRGADRLGRLVGDLSETLAGGGVGGDDARARGGGAR
jgi:hypothetical protein